MRRWRVAAAVAVVAALAPTLTATAATWVDLASMPTGRSELAATAGRDGRIYAVGGNVNGIGGLTTVEAYTPSTNNWAAAAPMPTARANLAAATGPDGRIYAIGGNNSGVSYTLFDTVEAYTPGLNSWAHLAPMPTPRSGLAAVEGADGRIYALGGTDNGVVSTVEAYTPGTNRWATVAPMPTARTGLAATTGPDGRIYAIGGNGTSGGLNTVEAYTPATNKWAAVASMPTARANLTAATGPDGRIYAIGGIANTCCDSVEAYTPGTNRWVPVASLLTGGSGLAASTGPDGRIYVVGAGSSGNIVQAFDTKLNPAASTTSPSPAPAALALPKSNPFAPIRMPAVTPIPFLRSTIATGLPTPIEAFSSVGRTLASAGMAALAVLLILFPAQIFNRAIDDIDGDFAFWRPRAPRAQHVRRRPNTDRRGWLRRVAVVIVVLTTPLIGGFVDPHFGFNPSSGATFLAVFVAALWSVAVATIVSFAHRKARHRITGWRLNVLPAGLVIAAGGVAVSRLTDFQPGYLYGVVGAAVFAGSRAKHERGEDVLINTLVTMVIAFAAWFAWVPVNSAAAQAGAPWPLVGVDDLLGALFTGGLVTCTIGLIPLRFLPGGALAAWHRGVWALTASLVTFAFVAILLNPARGGHPGRAAPVTAILVAVVVGGGALLFAAYAARRRPPRAIAPTGGTGAPA